MTYPKDATGKEVKIGDKVKGEGFIKFQDGFKIDRSPEVVVHEKYGVLMFGGLSAKSFNKFWIVTTVNNATVKPKQSGSNNA